MIGILENRQDTITKADIKPKHGLTNTEGVVN